MLKRKIQFKDITKFQGIIELQIKKEMDKNESMPFGLKRNIKKLYKALSTKLSLMLKQREVFYQKT